MQRINTSNKADNLFGAGKHGFKAGTPGTSDRPTNMSADIMNALQEEPSNVIEAAGLPLNPANNAQLLEALRMHMQKFTPKDFAAVLDGVADTRSSIVAADAKCTELNLELVFTPGVHRVASSVTVNQPTDHRYGAVLKPAAGATITLTKPVKAGRYQIFDLSLGGTVSLPPGTTKVPPEWWGASVDGVTDDATALGHATSAVGITGAGGGVIKLAGMSAIGSTLVQPNRVRLVGANVRVAGLKASAGFAGTYMLNAVNGAISLFDAGLQGLTIDCSDVIGLSGVLAEAWQENSDVRRVLVHKFRGYGIHYQSGFGGASSHLIQNAEIFGSTSGAIAGIRVENISAVGGFKLSIRDSTIAGGGLLPSSLPRAIDIVNDSTSLDNVHFEVCQTGIYVDGVGHHTIECCDGAGGTSLVDTLVEIAATFTGSLTMIGCKRNGATNFIKDNRVGGIGTITGRDIPHLHISATPDAIHSQNTAKALAVFDGTGAGPYTLGAGISSAFNVASIAKTGVGRWRVTLTRQLHTASMIAMISTNTVNATYTSSIVGTQTVDVGINVGGAATDSNEIKLVVFAP